jgi:hypothetical protein
MKRPLGFYGGQITIAPDFDEPLPDDVFPVLLDPMAKPTLNGDG